MTGHGVVMARRLLSGGTEIFQPFKIQLAVAGLLTGVGILLVQIAPMRRWFGLNTG